MARLIGAVVLAAGASARLGRPKQLLDRRGRSLVDHAVTCALDGGCAPVIVVLGAHADAVRATLEETGVTILINPDWREGMSSSVRAAVTALESGWPDARAVLFLTCDQSEITPAIVRTLRERFAATDRRIVACEYAGTLGVPAVIDRSLFPELLRLRGDTGARSLIRKRTEDVERVPWPEGARDIDTEADEAGR